MFVEDVNTFLRKFVEQLRLAGFTPTSAATALSDVAECAETGDWGSGSELGGAPLTKKLVLKEGELLRFPANDPTVDASFAILRKGDYLYIGWQGGANSDEDGATEYFVRIHQATGTAQFKYLLEAPNISVPVNIDSLVAADLLAALEEVALQGDALAITDQVIPEATKFRVLSASGAHEHVTWTNLHSLIIKKSPTAAPTASSDHNNGYFVGSLWLEVDANKLWVCLDDTAGAAVWKSVTLT